MTDPFYLTREWHHLRGQVLARDPVCVECRKARATHADHVIPRRIAPKLELNVANVRGLCPTCHNSRSRNQYAIGAGGAGLDGQPLEATHPWHAGEALRVHGTSPEPWQAELMRRVLAKPRPGKDEAPVVVRSWL